MRDYTIKGLLELKKAVDSGKVAQQVEVTNTKSFVDSDYYTRRKKLEDIKSELESKVFGITVEVTGGYNKPDPEEPDGMIYDPIIITTFKSDDKRYFSRIKMDGFYLNEPNPAKLVYENYLDFIVNGNNYVERGVIAFWETVIADALYETCLSECGFSATSNSLLLFKDEQMYTIIADIDKEVEGTAIIYLPGEEDSSLLIFCKDKNVLLSGDCFYINDAPEKEVA